MNEVEAAQRLMTAGAVGVVDVTVTPVYRPCAECGEDVDYIPESKRRSIADPGWVHVATGKGWGGDGAATLENHLAHPLPRCRKCGSENYAYSETPWGNQWDCQDCGQHDYYSIGD